MSEQETEEIYELLLFYRDGRCIHHTKFESLPVEVDEDLISGFLSAVSQFATDVLPSDKPLKEIKKGDIKVVYEVGNNVSAALIASVPREDLLLRYRSSLKDLLVAFETEYLDVLADWKGDLSVFPLVVEMVREHFRDAQLTKPEELPSIEEITENQEIFYFGCSGDAEKTWNDFYRQSRGFQIFLERQDIRQSKADDLFNFLNSQGKKMNSTEIAKAIDLPIDKTISLLVNLTRRKIVEIFRFTPK